MSRINGRVEEVARNACTSLLPEIEGASSIVIATADGFELGHAGNKRFSGARLAALTSSFAALGDLAAQETGIGDLRCLVVEALEGRLVVRRIGVQGHQLVLMVLADRSVMLGLLWSQMRNVEHAMTAELGH